MNFVDFAFVRLAQEATRASVFDQDSLEQIVAAGYGADVTSLAGPYSGLFDEFQMGVAIPRRATVDGHWGPITGMERTEVQLALAGLGRSSTVRVDALWRGSVVARTAPANARIQQVMSSWPDTNGIDEEIIAALGSLPADPAALEHERRTRFLARVRASFSQPLAFDDARFDEWLQRIGAQSIGDLMARYHGQLLTGALQVAFTDPAATPASPKALPLSAAILIRDVPLSIAELLADSKMIRECLLDAGVERAPDPVLSRRAPLVVVWVVPSTVFDDADWPGADGPARRLAAASWLGAEGIAVALLSKQSS
jgi:hypothetical protein